MRRYYEGQNRNVCRTLSVYLRSSQHTAPCIGLQRRAREREEEQRRLGGQRSERLYVVSADVKLKQQQQNVQDGNILLPIVLQRIAGTEY